MNLTRGDVALARFPHAAGGKGKKRPVVVVQSDVYNPKLRHVIVAEVTTNRAQASDAANLLIEVATPEGQATGLVQDSVVTCLHLATMSEDRIGKVIGKLPPALLGSSTTASRRRWGCRDDEQRFLPLFPLRLVR